MAIVQQRLNEGAGPAATVDYAPREVLARHNADGTIILQCCISLTDVESNIVNYLEQWAAQRPDQVFLAQRTPDRAGEFTDKGYVNQRGVLANRTALVDDLYADNPSNSVFAIAI